MTTRLAVCITVCTVLLPACTDGTGPAPTTSPNSAASTGEVSARVADLDRFVELVERLHPDPFHDVDEQAWRAAVSDLRSRIDDLGRAATLVEIGRLANLGERDGHAGMFTLAQDDLGGWPLWLYDLDGELTLVAVDGDPGVPLGSRLVAIGSVPVDEIVDAVTPIVPADNAQSRRARIPSFLIFPDVLRGLGLVGDGPIELTWRIPGGTQATRPAPSTVPAEELRAWFGAFQVQVPPSLPPDPSSPLLTLQRRDETFWWTRVPDSDALYVAYNQVQPADPQGGSLVGLLDELRTEVERDAPGRVVIDVRHNPGGETDTSRPMTEWIQEVEGSRPGTVRILMGRSTFSAASLFVTDVQEATDVVLVGEATGGAPNLYSQQHRVDLEALGVTVFVATRDEGFNPGDDRLTIEPDVPVWFTWEDLAGGRDPVLEAALP